MLRTILLGFGGILVLLGLGELVILMGGRSAGDPAEVAQMLEAVAGITIATAGIVFRGRAS